MNGEEVKRIRAALAQAMRTESDGAAFYRMAAKSIGDAKGREVFQQFALEEDKHFSYLKRHYDSLGEKAEWVAFDLVAPEARAGSDAIFSEELVSRIGSAQFEMTALSVGIKLELDSERYYREQAKKESDHGVVRFWESLADWEKQHYTALLDQYDALKESYWNSQGFSPF